jgi:Flp pilus assembly pilin Flp
LVEYAIVVAGVALVGIAAVSLFGHKVSDMMGAVTVILPGAHVDDNGPLVAGELVETGPVGPDGSIGVDVNAVISADGTGRLTQNLFGDGTLGATMLKETNP